MHESQIDEAVVNDGKRSREAYLPLVGFALVCALPLLLDWNSTRALGSLAINNDTYSHIPLIPLVTLFLIYMDRRSIFACPSYGWRTGTAFLFPGIASLVVARLNLGLAPADHLSLLMFAVVLIWVGAFALFFGTAAFRRALFPLLFLFFAVPIPDMFLSQLITMLQRRSADAAAAMFNLTGVPVLRQDLVFVLPGISIRVAEECSGIRSTLALMITTVLAAHFFLRSRWSMLVLCALVLPIAVLKNGMRIATLTILAVYVNPGFLYGNLHHYGGIPFFLLDLLMLGLFLVLLRRLERGGVGHPSGPSAQPAR